MGTKSGILFWCRPAGLAGRMGSGLKLAFVAALVFSAISFASAQQPAQQPTSTSAAPGQSAAKTPVNASKTAAPAASPAPQTPLTPQQKQLADDTAKLLALANELKAELDKSTKDTLSLSVIRKAEQVEKLARKVRDR